MHKLRVKRLSTLITLALMSSLSQAQVSRLEVISYSDAASNGLQGNANSQIESHRPASMSNDGRYVVFESSANNLVPSDTNATYDVFVHDRYSGTTTRVSVSSSGVQGNNGSHKATISADGRYVAFSSDATNLVAGDTNVRKDVFVHDLILHTTQRVSLNSAGVESDGHSYDPAISADGSKIAFTSGASNLSASDSNGAFDIYLRDRTSSTTSLVSATSSGIAGNADSGMPSISADGKFVTYTSDASDLVAGDTNGFSDVFLYENSGPTQRLSVSTGGAQGNDRSYDSDISDDGKLIAFIGAGSNLVAGDSNARPDVFVRNTSTGTTTRISLSAAGVEADGTSWAPAFSGDGSKVSFFSVANNLTAGDIYTLTTDVFVKDIGSGQIDLVSTNSGGVQGLGSSSFSSLSATGAIVAFDSNATDLVSGDTNASVDVFARDTGTGITRRVSLPSDSIAGAAATACCNRQLSGDGRYAVFSSSASNLVPGDTNLVADIFVHDRLQGTSRRVSISSAGVESNGSSDAPAISTNGRYVVFRSNGSNLVAGDTDGKSDIFVHDLQTQQTAIASLSNTGAHSTMNSGAPAISGDGRYVAFATRDDLISGGLASVDHIYVRDLQGNTTTRESVNNGGVLGNSHSESPALSSDGRYIAFASSASNLVLGDSNAKMDIFRRDRQSGVLARMSVTDTGLEVNGDSKYPALSDDGMVVAFESVATNLIAGDTNGVSDVFARNLTPLAPYVLKRASVGTGGQANGASTRAALSGDGTFAAYNSLASNLVSGDTNGVGDVFASDLIAVSASTDRLSMDAANHQGEAASTGPSLSTDGSSAIFDSLSESAWTIDAGLNGLYKDLFWIKR